MVGRSRLCGQRLRRCMFPCGAWVSVSVVGVREGCTDIHFSTGWARVLSSHVPVWMKAGLVG
jgi:hypothetical protein